MIKFLDKRKNEINQAFSIRFDGDKAFVKFSRSGKEYKYYKINIEIVDEMPSYGRFPFVLYEYNKQCYNCKSYIGVLTYIVYHRDKGNISVMYPWNKKRLYNNQDWDMPTLHMLDPSIEYYGIKVLEEIYDFDEILVNEFPKRIQFRYSNILDRVYAMNVCPICDAPQGKNYVYRDVNKKIKSMEKINIVK